MKKIAMLLAVSLLLTGTAVYAEDAENTQTEVPGLEMPEQEMPELGREVWRGEVTAVDEDSITLKIIEYNPENPRLPEPEDEMTELPEGEQPEAIPGEEASDEIPEDESVPMKGEDEETETEETSEPEAGAENTAPENADGTPVEIVSLMLTGETLYYSSTDAGLNEEAADASEAGAPEESSDEAPAGNYHFEEAALDDIAVGDILTVEVIDGAAGIVVIETDAKISGETDM